MAVTRSKTFVYLIGERLKAFQGTVLPTTRDVLQVYMYYHKTEKCSQTEAITVTARQVCEIWNKARIPTSEERNIKRKMEQLLDKYRMICRNRKRSTAAQSEKELTFEADINTLFDISHHQAMDLIKIEEDRVFLNDQRTERKYVMGKIDKHLASVEERRLFRLEREACLKEKEVQRKRKQAENPTESMMRDESDDSASEESDQTSKELSYCTTTKKHCKEVKKARISPNEAVTPHLAAALDRTGVSNREAAYILHAAATSYGQDPSNMSLSVSSIRRSRSLYRVQAASAAKAAFRSDGPLVVHFDGKLLPSITGGPQKEDRVAVLVSGKMGEKLLAIPSVVQGTGEQIASAAAKAIHEWDVAQDISGMSFDTTTANTGHLNGACVLLEQKFGKELLWLACRHHMCEILCGDVFRKLFGTTSGPNVSLFQKFRDYWPRINHEAYKSCSDSRLGGCLASLKQETLVFCQDVLTGKAGTIPREDYRELVELTLIFLGERPPRGIHFRMPGAFHHARWMSKLLYVLKINLFRDQFQLTRQESKASLEFGLFISLLYVKTWMTCGSSCDAPINDLSLLQSLSDYRSISEVIADTGIAAVRRHLWYLGQELVPLSLFSDLVSIDIKSSMASYLLSVAPEVKKVGADRSIKYTGKEDISGKTVDFFLGPRSHFFFRILNINTSFLAFPVDQWPQLDDYQHAKLIAQSLKVVNDSAERAIALATDFNKSLTKREDEKQYLFQVVETHRKKFPDAKKSTLSSSTANN